MLDNQITMIINKTFENHEDLDTNNGILVALPKPGKKRTTTKSAPCYVAALYKESAFNYRSN